jgi:hypothetical protein
MPLATHHRPPLRTLLLALGGLLGLVTGAGCRQASCPTLCQRARACRAEVAEALVERLPTKSPALQHVRTKLPERLMPALLASCRERCEALQKSRRWRERLRRCEAIGDCARFARCIAPALEP